MDYAPPPAPGSRIQELGDRLTVSFRPHRSWPALAFIGFWLTLWTFAGIAALLKVMDGNAGDRAFMLFWLCMWAFGECAAIVTLGWGLFGSEVLTVTPAHLELRRAIGRFARKRRFDAALVRDLKATRTPVEEGRSRTPYWLEIWLPKKTVLVGDGLGEREAEYIASVLLNRIRPRRGWSDDLSAVVAEPPSSEPSFRWRNAVFPVIVVVLLAYLGYSTLSDRSSGARPPAAKGFSDPRAYAVATTRSSLSAANMRILGRVDCGDRATWTEWACTARVEGTSGYFAGRRFTYRCVPTRGELPDGRQGDLVECGAVAGT